MPSLDTTNLILGILAITSVAQLLLILGTMIFVAQKMTQLRREIARFDLAPLRQKVEDMAADLHGITIVTERLARDVGQTVRGARTVVDAVGAEVTRVSRFIDLGLGLFGGAYRRAFAVGMGVRSGVRELLRARASSSGVAGRLIPTARRRVVVAQPSFVTRS